MTQIIKTERQDDSALSAILIVLVIAALVAFGVWFFTGNATVPQTQEREGINVNVELPSGGEQTTPEAPSNTAQ